MNCKQIQVWTKTETFVTVINWTPGNGETIESEIKNLSAKIGQQILRWK